MNDTQRSMPPPHEDPDCHRPAPRRWYSIRTQVRGERPRTHVAFGRLGDAVREAEDLADERVGMWSTHRYEFVELWEGAHRDRKLMVWYYGRLQAKAVSA